MNSDLKWMGPAALLMLAGACAPNLHAASPTAAYRLQRQLLDQGDRSSYAKLWSQRWKRKSWPRIAKGMRTWAPAKLKIYGIDPRQVKQLSDAAMLRAFFANPRLKGAMPSPKATLSEKIKGQVGIVEARLKQSVCTQIFLKEGGVWRIATMPYCPPPETASAPEVGTRLDFKASSAPPPRNPGRQARLRARRAAPRRRPPPEYDGPAERELVGGAWCDLQDDLLSSSLHCRRTDN